MGDIITINGSYIGRRGPVSVEYVLCARPFHILFSHLTFTIAHNSCGRWILLPPSIQYILITAYFKTLVDIQRHSTPQNPS